MIVTYVPSEYLDTVWGVCGAMVRKAAEFNGGRYTARDIYKGIGENRMQLWIVFDNEDENKNIYGTIVTTVTDYPSKKFLTILMVGGSKMNLWIEEADNILTKWANDCGCSGIEGYGRLGWKRVLERFGGKRLLTVFQKEIG